MLDVVLKGGQIVDGTGSVSTTGSVGVRDGKIVAIGEVDVPAATTIDADGLVVAPGFVDVHTHYDAQAFWDPTLGPSTLHGITTVFGGNCGFSVAPLREASADYVMRMLGRVEGMPVESLASGVPWDWQSSGEYLERVEGRLTPNSGWLCGHSALRCAVMGEDAWSPATPGQIEQMKQLLRQGLEAGAMGFSSSWTPGHNDHRGLPVPSRSAVLRELKELCEVVGSVPGTVLEFSPPAGLFDEASFEVLTTMSATANRPVNWNAILAETQDAEYVSHQLSANERAVEHGGKVFALAPVDSRRHRLNFDSGELFDALPGWREFMSLGHDEKMAYLRDSARSAALEVAAGGAIGFYKSVADWPNYVVTETFSGENDRFSGRGADEIAKELGCTPWEALVSVILADDLRTVLVRRDTGQDEVTWRRRLDLWRDPRVVVGASDAGAHLDMTDAFCYPTTLLGKVCRDLGLLSVEEAVYLLTSRPAGLYGLVDRGVIRIGAAADLVVFDPATVAPGQVESRFDLPAGARRLYAEANGIERVFVNGVETVRNGSYTEARPGKVLRAGQDTATVPAR